MSARGLSSAETTGLQQGNLRAGLACLGGALALFLLYTSGLLDGFDHAGLSLMQGLRSESLTKRVLEISALGSLPVLFLIGVVSVSYLYALGEQKTTIRFSNTWLQDPGPRISSLRAPPTPSALITLSASQAATA